MRGEGKFCSISCGISFRNTAIALERDPKVAFINKVIKSKDKNGCWIFPTNRIYGSVKINKKTISAHRYSYEIHKDKIPEGLSVLHKCDVPRCVNPKHLFLGTYKDNRQDMLKKNRGNFCKGSEHRCARLTEKDASIIKRCLLKGLSTPEITRKYKYDKTLIHSIKYKNNWRHVAPAA